MLQVLVVDDDQGMRETCGAALRHVGYGVHTADCGSAAITMLSSGADIHALLLDLKLADMTGYDVLRWMRTQVIDVPTAVMTAFRAEFEPDEAIALGALAYADQPLSLDDLLALVENLTSAPSPRDDPLRLHQRFLAGHPGALDCLASVYLESLPARLQRAFPRVPWDFAVDATTDACLEYGANPARFDASRTSIIDFVYLIARRNLSNRVRSETALKDRESRYADEHAAALPLDLQIGRLDNALWLAVVAVTVDPRERRAAERWFDDAGVDAIAEALGVGHLALKDRRHEAKRFKDRLLKRLSRHFRPIS